MDKPSDAQVEQVARAMDVDGVLDWTSTDHDKVVAVYMAMASASAALIGFMACSSIMAGEPAQPPSTPYPDPAPPADAPPADPAPETVTAPDPIPAPAPAPDTPDETAPAAPADPSAADQT
jgi:hypothetical protein